MKNRNNKGLKSIFNNWILRGAIIFIAVILFIVAALFSWVNYQAKSVAQTAAAEFKIEKTQALLAVIDSENHSLKEKNNAVWALGVLKETDALPKLESIYSGEECNHDSEICQYEVEKAIQKIKGNFRGSWNISR